MVPKQSRFCPKGPNFAIVASFRAKSQIPNPVSERLHISSYECCHWSRPWLGLATERLRDQLVLTEPELSTSFLPSFLPPLITGYVFWSKKGLETFQWKAMLLQLKPQEMHCKQAALPYWTFHFLDSIQILQSCKICHECGRDYTKRESICHETQIWRRQMEFDSDFTQMGWDGISAQKNGEWSLCFSVHTSCPSFIQLSSSSQVEKTRGNGCFEAATKVTIADGSSSTVAVHNIFFQARQ